MFHVFFFLWGLGFGLRVPGVCFRVSCVLSRILGPGFNLATTQGGGEDRVSGFVSRVPGSGNLAETEGRGEVWVFGLWVSCSRFRLQGTWLPLKERARSGVAGLGLRVQGFRFRQVWGLGFRVSSSGFEPGRSRRKGRGFLEFGVRLGFGVWGLWFGIRSSQTLNHDPF